MDIPCFIPGSNAEEASRAILKGTTKERYRVKNGKIYVCLDFNGDKWVEIKNQYSKN